MKEPDVVNIVGTSGMTRSGRIFSPEVLQNKVVEKTSVPPIVKNTSVTPNTGSSKSMPTPDETLKIIKKSDYQVVEQLNQTP